VPWKVRAGLRRGGACDLPLRRWIRLIFDSSFL